MALPRLFRRDKARAARRPIALARLRIEALEQRAVLAATYSAVNDWGTGLQGQIAVQNDQAVVLSPWRVEFDYARTIDEIWDAQVISHVGNHYVIEGASYNSALGVGQTITFGFIAGPGTDAPVNLILTGAGAASDPVAITIGNVSVTEGNPSTAGGTGYFHTSGNQILDSNNQVVRIAGVNWYGLETPGFAPQGLWARNYKSMMDQMKSAGFNTIRLPYSNELFDAGSVPNSIDFTKNPDLQGLNGLQIMDKIVDYAGQINMRILLDHHRSDAGSSANESGLWYTAEYPESRWISDWKMLATRYAGNTTIIGADLHNEPHGPAVWGDGSANDWRLAAERAGNAVLSVNPDWLIVVGGVEQGSSGWYWWGGNLSDAATYPVRLNVPGRLVYSPHDYPASLYRQPWFNDPNYPNNLPEVWDETWGYLFRQNIAPILLGEFGSRLETTSDRQWFTKLVNYLGGDLDGNGTNDLQPGQQGISWTYWSWSPNSSQEGGLISDDWTTLQQAKIDQLKPIQFAFGQGSAAETFAVFTVTLSQASSETVTVNYATANGSATSGSDYTSTSGTLTFAPGQTSRTISVPVRRDLVNEPTETFTLLLSNASGATIDQPSAVATIVDDDVAPPSASIADVSVTEGNSGQVTARFTVTLSAPATGSVSIAYATANGTASSGSDYLAKSGTLVFATGETSKTIDVSVVGDTLVEANETFLVRLASASGATIATSQATGTIVNDDQPPPPPTISIGNASVTEGNSGTTTLSFTVTLSRAATSTVSVQYATVDGTATAGSDYAAKSGTVTFAPGETSKTISVSVTRDTTVEANEAFLVQLSSASGATIATSQATGTIVNDDQPPAPPTISIGDAAVSEGNSGTTKLTFTITLSRASTTPVTVQYATTDGSATAGSDYIAGSGTITFAPGVVSQTVTVTVLGDTLVEGSESLRVVLTNAVGATISDGNGTGTIANDDANMTIPVTLSQRRDRNGYTVTATIKNTSGQTINSWRLEFDLSTSISNLSNARIVSRSGNHYVLEMLSGSQPIAPGGQLTISFRTGGSNRMPTSAKFTRLS